MNEMVKQIIQIKIMLVTRLGISTKISGDVKILSMI